MQNSSMNEIRYHATQSFVYNLNMKQQSAKLVINPITDDNFDSHYDKFRYNAGLYIMLLIWSGWAAAFLSTD